MHRDPQQGEAGEIGPQPPHAKAVEREHPAQDQRRSGERGPIQVGGIGEGDDRHRADVIDDRDRHQQQFQLRRRAGTKQGQNAEREGDVGRRRNRPARGKRRIEAGDAKEDQRRKDHPRSGGDDRQAAFVGGRQPPFEPFALYLQPDQQEEQRHRGIGDPLVDGQRPGLKFKSRMIGIGKRRICKQQCCRRTGNQKQPSEPVLHCLLLRIGDHCCGLT